MANAINVISTYTNAKYNSFSAQTENIEMGSHLIDLLVEDKTQAFELTQKNGELDLADILNTVANAVTTYADEIVDYCDFKSVAVKAGSELRDYVEVTCKQCELICRVKPTDSNSIQHIARACRRNIELSCENAQDIPEFTEVDLVVVYGGAHYAYFKAYVGWDKQVRIQTMNERHALFVAENEGSCR